MVDDIGLVDVCAQRTRTCAVSTGRRASSPAELWSWIAAPGAGDCRT